MWPTCTKSWSIDLKAILGISMLSVAMLDRVLRGSCRIVWLSDVVVAPSWIQETQQALGELLLRLVGHILLAVAPGKHHQQTQDSLNSTREMPK